MRDHFKNEHYLCEEGDCAQEQFTAVFRTDIDLKAHKAHIHCRNMGKVAAKQARTLEFEFTLAPRIRPNQNNQQGGGESSSLSRGPMRVRNDPQMEFEIEDQGGGGFVQTPQRVIDHNNEEEFPSLGGGGATALTMNVRPNLSIRAKAFGSSNLSRTAENFPALGGSGNSTNESDPSLSYNNNQSRNTTSSLLKSQKLSGNGGSGSGGGMIIHVSNRPKSTPVAPLSTRRETPITKQHDFPALPGAQKSRHAAADLDDYMPAPLPAGSMSAVAAKHKQLLLDGYAPVSSGGDSKFNLIKSDSGPASPTISKSGGGAFTTKLNSRDNFPALSAPSSSTMTSMPLKWSAPIRQKVEPKKMKVAPAPLLTNSFPVENGYKKSTGNEIKSESTTSAAGKKEKKIQVQKNGNVTTALTNNNNNNRNNNNVKLTTKENNSLINSGKKMEMAIDRKMSAMKIDKNLDDFPVLGGGGGGVAAAIVPPGFEKKSKNVTGGPPGFNKVTVNSVARPRNNLTFTTSTGESFNIRPSHKYIPPPNSSKRNQVLVTSFQQAVNVGVMEEFRRISQLYKEGSYNTLPYYEHCQAALGEKFDEIFPELLTLLPDISKQQVGGLLFFFKLGNLILIKLSLNLNPI